METYLIRSNTAWRKSPNRLLRFTLLKTAGRRAPSQFVLTPRPKPLSAACPLPEHPARLNCQLHHSRTHHPPAAMPPLNKYSSRVTQPKSQGASQAMLYGAGLTSDDMNKAQVGIASVWYEGNTCNMHLKRLAERVKAGVDAAGLVGMRFNTVGVSDGISMGTEGMSYSLQSRDLIADSIETVMGGQWYDALIALPGC